MAEEINTIEGEVKLAIIFVNFVNVKANSFSLATGVFGERNITALLTLIKITT